MKIDVQKVAKLSNLKLTPYEEKEFEDQLNSIVSYIDQLNKKDTSTVDPTAHVTGIKNVTRSDEVDNCMLTVDDALSGTDKKHNNMFVVDKLVDTTE